MTSWDLQDGVTGEAVVSINNLYRYRLMRRWDEGDGVMAFVMLNPSTADGRRDDPTIRKCMAFARREGCAGIDVVNLYALRATDPKELVGHVDAEGPENEAWWREALLGPQVRTVVAAWGATSTQLKLPPSKAMTRHVGAGLVMHCLGATKDEFPKHPLYLKASTPLVLWMGP